jgi:thymidylate synthase (FAD)
VLQDQFYIPAQEDLALQAKDNRQGREDKPLETSQAEKIQGALKEGQERAYAGYKDLVDQGLAREIARINLPLSIYSEWYWQMDLHNLFHFLQLRLDSHAQREIRMYAQTILDITGKVAPRCVASFKNWMRDSVNFSGEEMKELRRRLAGSDEESALKGKALARFEDKLKTGKQE